MSWLKNMFGGNTKKEPVVSPESGLESLETTIDTLEKKKAHFEGLIEEQEKIIKENVNTNKKKALEALKKKKSYINQLEKTESALLGLENQKELLENAKLNTAIMQTMSQTAKSLKKQHDNMDMNKLEDIVDDIREQQEVAKEISDIIANTGAIHRQHDDEELLDELEKIGQEQLDAKLLETDITTPALPELPKIPTETVPVASTSRVPIAVGERNQPAKKPDDELEELKMWAS